MRLVNVIARLKGTRRSSGDFGISNGEGWNGQYRGAGSGHREMKCPLPIRVGSSANNFLALSRLA